MLEGIMRRGTSSLGADVPSEREINRLAARTQEEFRIFEEMDKERRRKENYRSRLMEDHEVPEWAYSAANPKEEKGKGFDKNSTGVLGKRRRKEVTYADTLSDLQWLKAVENGEDISNLSSRGKRREHRPPSEDNEPTSNNAGSENAGIERKAPEVRTETAPSASEETSENTLGSAPKKIKFHVAAEKAENQGVEKPRGEGGRDSGWAGRQLFTWNTYKKKRSSYTFQSSLSDSRGQNSAGRGNGFG